MKSRPIPFSGPMVRAILEGRKTQTRRVVKPQPTHRLIEGLAGVTIGMDPKDDGGLWYDADCINPGKEVRCKYGTPGDQLWVQESFLKHDGELIYKADDIAGHIVGPWENSIHMPRWASRITLEIEAVRVERLQDITEEDAVAEGVDIGWPPHEADQPTPTMLYERLWETINGLGSWNANPWVWVIQFRKMKGEG